MAEEYRYENGKDILDFKIGIHRYNIMHATRLIDNKRIYVLSVLVTDPDYHLKFPQLEYNSLEKAVDKLNWFLNSNS